MGFVVRSGSPDDRVWVGSGLADWWGDDVLMCWSGTYPNVDPLTLSWTDSWSDIYLLTDEDGFTVDHVDLSGRNI